MPLPIRLSHIAGGLALILAMLAALFSAPGATAQTGDSSIEVHNRVCPQDYQGENWFEDCHSNVPDPGLPFTFSDGVTREGTTNENGNVGFANLPAGAYTITGGAPGEFTDYVVYCSTEGTNEQVPVEYITGGIQLDLAEDTNVLCDWYTIPQGQDGVTPTPTEPVDGDSSIEVHNRVCPTDYQGDSWFDDCHGNTPDPGLPFTFADGVTREGMTNENGNVGFANLPAGTYAITGGAPGEFTDYVVYCFNEATDEEVPTETITGGISVDLSANSNVICDWYTIPLSQNGAPTATEPTGNNSSIEVHNRLCPTAYEGENWFEDCHDTVADPGLTFTFANGVTQEGTTNENGNVGFANLPVGTYTITGGVPDEFADYVVYCAVGTEADSNQEQIPVDYVTGGIQLELPANTNVICDWYEIPYDLQGQTPTATAQPEMFDLPIYKLLCDSAPSDTAANDFVMMGTMPDGCEQLGGVSVTVTAADDTVLGSCETQSAEPCYVTVPIGSTVYATEDLTTVPDGYVPADGETIEYTIEPATEAWILFVNVPAVQTPAPPTETPVGEEGRMVSIHEGSCTQDEPGTLVTELADLRGPDTADDADVVISETSSSVVSLTLDDLTGSEHALVAYSDDDDPTPVACTVIAGETNANGELVLGLQEQDDSDYTGIVYLAPTGDGSETGISVFLAEELSEDSTPSTPAA